MPLTLQTAVESIASLKGSSDPAGQCNMACERLYSFGKYKGLTKPLYLKAYEDGTITLPQDYETLIGARIKGVPQRLHDPWFQFVPSGNGLNLAEPGLVSMDLGDGHVAYRKVTGASDLRIACDPGDRAKTFSAVIRVTPEEGITARFVTIAGELGDFLSTCGLAEADFEQNNPADTLVAPGTPDAIISFTKDATAGLISLEACFDGVWAEVARFMPRDTEICLRRYSIPHAHTGDIVLSFCKRRFRPVSQTNDILPIDSVYVLRLALEALGYEMAGDLVKAQAFWDSSKKALDDALHEHRSSVAPTVPIFCRAAAGAGLRAIR